MKNSLARLRSRHNPSGYNLWAEAVEPDPAARMALFAKAEEILVREAPVLPIYYYTATMLVRPGLEGVQSNLQNRIDFSLLRWR